MYWTHKKRYIKCPLCIFGNIDVRDGGKKDAAFIAHYMMEFVKLYDPNKTLTDVFFFDGASNVQKGGEILEMEYPRAVTNFL